MRRSCLSVCEVKWRLIVQTQPRGPRHSPPAGRSVRQSHADSRVTDLDNGHLDTRGQGLAEGRDRAGAVRGPDRNLSRIATASPAAGRAVQADAPARGASVRRTSTGPARLSARLERRAGVCTDRIDSGDRHGTEGGCMETAGEGPRGSIVPRSTFPGTYPTGCRRR